MTNKELTDIVKSLAASVVHHDDQIEGLIKVAELNSVQIAKNSEQIAELQKAMARTEREWQAYIKTLRPQ